MFKPKKIVAAVAIATAGSAMALSSAQADTLFFPQIAVGGTITTIISTLNGGEPWDSTTKPIAFDALHYRYFWKEWTSKADNSDDKNTTTVENACTERNRFLPTSKYDLQTFDVGGVAFGSAGRGVMFQDESSNNRWNRPSVDFRLGANLTGSPPSHRAYLLVDNASGDMNGEAIIVDIANGASWGYQAHVNPDSEDYDFTATASAFVSLVAYMPVGDVTTRFLITALSDDMSVNPYVEGAFVSAEIEVAPGEFAPGSYDRDENPTSGGATKHVTCIGAWDIEDIYPDALAVNPDINGVTYVHNWKDVVEDDGTVTPGRYTDTDAAHIFKLEYGGDIDGTAMGGIWNNAIYLHPDFDVQVQ